MPRAPKQAVERRGRSPGSRATQFKPGQSGNPAGLQPAPDFSKILDHMVARHNERNPGNPLNRDELIGHVGDLAALRGKSEVVFRALLQHTPKTTIKPIRLEDFDLTDLDSVTEQLVGKLLNGGDVASITAALTAVQTLADVRASEAERKALEKLER